MIHKFVNYTNKRRVQQRAKAMSELKYYALTVDGELKEKLNELADTIAENEETKELIIIQNKNACKSVTMFMKTIGRA